MKGLEGVKKHKEDVAMTVIAATGLLLTENGLGLKEQARMVVPNVVEKFVPSQILRPITEAVGWGTGEVAYYGGNFIDSIQVNLHTVAIAAKGYALHAFV